jgi:hypothetical protein
MLSGVGNPTTHNLFAIIAHLQSKEGISLEVVPERIADEDRLVRPS